MISPGTEFMKRTSNALSRWIQEKQLSDSLWMSMHVILSDDRSPGEGEHKIVQHIRRMRSLPHYNPETSHVIAGRDADLILLALGTHEHNIRILRHETFFGKAIKCPMCFRQGHSKDCVYPVTCLPARPHHNLVFFDILMFRQCLLQVMLKEEPNPESVNKSQIINDFIMISFLMGNDFLPKIPGLAIRCGSLDFLLEIYVTMRALNRTTITTPDGEVNAEALKLFMKLTAEREPDLVTQQFRLCQRSLRGLRKQRANMRKALAQAEENGDNDSEDGDDSDDTPKTTLREDFDRLQELFPHGSFERTSLKWFNTLTLNQQCRYLRYTMFVVPVELRDTHKSGPFDLHWKRLYYNNKFGMRLSKKVAKKKLYTQNESVQAVLNEYMKGLLWCYKYYTRENPDWNWFYPYYYGPCISDVAKCKLMPFDFPESKPLDPAIALLSILPYSDFELLPKPFQALVTESTSPVNDMFPSHCEVDYTDAYVTWQGIWKVPFMDPERLNQAVDPLIPILSSEEQCRNTVTYPRVFVSDMTGLGHQLQKLYGEPVVVELTDEGEGDEEDHPREASDEILKMQNEDEFSLNTQTVRLLKNFVPKSNKDGHSSYTAYTAPLPVEEFSLKWYEGGATTEPLPKHKHNPRRFGSLRNTWHQILKEDRKKRVAEQLANSIAEASQQKASQPVVEQTAKVPAAPSPAPSNNAMPPMNHFQLQAMQMAQMQQQLYMNQQQQPNLNMQMNPQINQQNLNMQMNSLLNYPNQMNMFNVNQLGGMFPMQQLPGQMQPNPMMGGMQGQMQNPMMNGMIIPNMPNMGSLPGAPGAPNGQMQGQMQSNPMMNGMMVPNLAGSPMANNANGSMFPFVMDPNSIPGFNPNLNNGGFMQNMNGNRMPNMVNNQMAQSPADANRVPNMMNGQIQPNNQPQSPNGDSGSSTTPSSAQSMPMFLAQPPNGIGYNPLAQPMQQQQQLSGNNSVNGNPAYSPQLSNPMNQQQQQQLPMMPGVYAGSPAGMNNQGGFSPVPVFPQVSFQPNAPAPSSMFINQPAINRRSVPVPPGL